jgi:hypothetical protein
MAVTPGDRRDLRRTYVALRPNRKTPAKAIENRE